MADLRLLTTPVPGVKEQPVLIIDKAGVIGYPLAHSLKVSFLPLIVTQKKVHQEIGMIHIPYGKTFPRLPNNTFSHIIVVFNGEKEILKLLPKLLRKAAKSGAQFSFITDYMHFSEELLKKLHGLPFVTTFIFGDIFGSSDTHSRVSELLLEGHEKKKVKLAHMGLKTRYPIHVTDVVSLVISTLFSPSQTVRLYFLASDGRTELSLLRLLQSIDPLIVMDFIQSSKKDPQTYVPSHAVHLFPTAKLHERLQEALHITDPSAVREERSISSPPQKKTKSPSVLLRFIVAGIILICLPLFIEIFAVIVGYGSLTLATVLLQKGETNVSHVVSEISLATFNTAEPSETLLTTAVSLLSLPYSQQGAYPIESGKNAAELLVSVSSVFQEMRTSLFREHPYIDESAKLSLKKSLLLLQNLQAQHAIPQSLKDRLKEDEQILSIITNITDVLPESLGYSGTKTYALLFQDNAELRPGGGFIRTFMTISIRSGKVIDTKVYDVYDTDSNLTGHIEPPFLLKRYLKTAHLLLRDASMSEVSAENASQAAALIPLETKQEVNGIMSVDLSFFRGLLGVTGPVYLKKEGVTVTKDTLFQQYEKSINQISESPHNSQFLADLLSSIGASLGQKNSSALLLSRFLMEAVNQKHLMVYSSESSIQKIISQNGATSSPSMLPAGDMIGLVESNLGANKANYFLQRKVMQTVTLHEDLSASESVKIQYNNASHHDVLGGDYTAYLQLVLPATASLQGIAINNTPQVLIPAVTDPEVFTSPLFKDPTGLEVSTQNEGNYQLVGFPLRVKDGEQREIVISYTIPPVGNNNKPIYSLSFFKQPGIDAIPYHLTLSYPPSLTVNQMPKTAEEKAGRVELPTTVVEDTTFTFHFRN